MEAKVRHFIDERFVVFSDSGNLYEIDMFRATCTCKGFRRWNRCKHLVIASDKIQAGEVRR